MSHCMVLHLDFYIFATNKLNVSAPQQPKILNKIEKSNELFIYGLESEYKSGKRDVEKLLYPFQ